MTPRDVNLVSLLPLPGSRIGGELDALKTELPESRTCGEKRPANSEPGRDVAPIRHERDRNRLRVCPPAHGDPVAASIKWTGRNAMTVIAGGAALAACRPPQTPGTP